MGNDSFTSEEDFYINRKKKQLSHEEQCPNCENCFVEECLFFKFNKNLRICASCGMSLSGDEDCANCEEKQIANSRDYYSQKSKGTNKSKSMRFEENLLTGCSCPICMGTPEKDPLFLYAFKGKEMRNSSQVPNYKPVKRNFELPVHPNYLAFDIEIAKVLPDEVNDIKAYRPLGITCAATLWSENSHSLWYSRTSSKGYAAQMSKRDLNCLVDYLLEVTQKGNQIVTWNGLGFDFDILAEESGRFEDCKELALNHVDMMFHFFCAMGFPLSLDTAAKGMGLPGKTEGMNGAQAPIMWQQGRQDQVLSYVLQDVKTTMGVALAVDRCRQLNWTSRRGKLQSVGFRYGWLPACEAAKLPIPDNSWMDDPWDRSRFTGWLQGNDTRPKVAEAPAVNMKSKSQPEPKLSFMDRLKKWLS